MLRLSGARTSTARSRGCSRAARLCRSTTRPPSANGTLRSAGPEEEQETAAVEPWTQQVANLGTQLVDARREALGLLSAPFRERAGELGLPAATLDYEGEPPTVAALEARLARDIERGVTGLGPHLDEIAIRSGSRELRSFGSQGEQRLAVLSLLLAEAEVLAESRGVPPLVLLDDVLSELDAARRRTLAERIGLVGQAIVTATGAEALPLAPAQLLEVTPGWCVSVHR